MRTNLKVILSAVGVAALLASPATAKSHARTFRAAPSIFNVPYDARASVAPYVSPGGVTVYAPHLWVRPLPSGAINPDFQLSHE